MQKLSTDEIGKSYKGRQVVRGVSVDVSQGEVVGLLGPNGAGKTTSFYMIVGLIAPDSGHILADGEDITRVPMYMRARQYGISYLPQEPSVFRKLTVEENILAVLEVQTSPAKRAARAPKSSSSSSISGISARPAAMRFPAASGAASRLPAASASSPPSFCWTSPFRESIPLRYSTCRKSSST